MSIITNARFRAPYVPIVKESLDEIVAALDVRPQSIAYDLGCGNGVVLFAAHKKEPAATYTGIEVNILPFLSASIQKLFTKDARTIKFIKKNFFNVSLTQATHVFTYLYPEVMDELLPKLVRELRPGTKLVSCDFTFTGKKPVRELDLSGASGRNRCKKLYIYEF